MAKVVDNRDDSQIHQRIFHRQTKFQIEEAKKQRWFELGSHKFARNLSLSSFSVRIPPFFPFQHLFQTVPYGNSFVWTSTDATPHVVLWLLTCQMGDDESPGLGQPPLYHCRESTSMCLGYSARHFVGHHQIDQGFHPHYHDATKEVRYVANPLGFLFLRNTWTLQLYSHSLLCYCRPGLSIIKFCARVSDRRGWVR